MNRRRFACIAGLILILAFALRLGGAVGWQRFVDMRGSAPFFFGDSDSYWQLGRALAAGAPYEHDPVRHWKVFRMPGYPVLLAPLFLVWNEPPVLAARLENVLLGVLTVFLTGLLARALFRSRRVTLLAMLLAAALPELVFQPAGVLSEELFCAANLALTLMMIKWVQSRLSINWGAGIGLFWALTVYVRPDALLWPPFAALAVLLLRDSRAVAAARARSAACGVFAAVFVFAALMTPWWVRNARLTGHFVPATLQIGASLYDGLSPAADGGSEMSFVDEFRRRAELNANGECDEFLLDRSMKKAALAWAKENPAGVLRLAGIKLIRLWNIFPNEPAFSGLPAKLVIVLTFFPLFLFALAGAFRFRRFPLTRLLWLPAVYLTLLHVIFVASLRYRAPILPHLAVLAAAALIKPRSTSEGSDPSKPV